jgi:hypothetical protein
MPLILGANSVTGGYDVANSCRFNDGSEDSLTRTPSSASNRRTWTFSAWVKRGNLGADQIIFSGGSANTWIRLLGTDALEFNIQDNDESTIVTTQLFRDISAWSHIVVAIDTTQGTDTNRIKFYVNGNQVTSFSTSVYVSQNYEAGINNTGAHYIGRLNYAATQWFDGYMSEVTFIDGQQLDPTSFGEFDEDSGIWKPIDVSGLTFGTNGFYLEFKDSSALGDDTSGTGNDWTVNNLTSIDQTTDTPTNNFATLNPLNFTPSAITYSEGNLKAVYPGSWNASISSIGVSAGKWYWEAKAVTGGNNIFYGIMTENATTNTATPYTQIGVLCGKTTDGDKYLDTTYTAGGFGTSANGDILGFALDLDSGTKNLSIYKNGTLITGGSVNLTSNFNNVNIFAFFAGNNSSASASWETNFGNPPYTVTAPSSDANGYGAFDIDVVPAGYYALCTKNLAEYG